MGARRDGQRSFRLDLLVALDAGARALLGSTTYDRPVCTYVSSSAIAPYDSTVMPWRGTPSASPAVLTAFMRGVVSAKAAPQSKPLVMGVFGHLDEIGQALQGVRTMTASEVVGRTPLLIRTG